MCVGGRVGGGGRGGGFSLCELMNVWLVRCFYPQLLLIELENDLLTGKLSTTRTRFSSL